MTPKEKVRLKFPEAFVAEGWDEDETWLSFIIESEQTATVLGGGRTARTAWADAARRMSK